jgi:nucleotide-binding universal stress UspA family protein
VSDQERSPGQAALDLYDAAGEAFRTDIKKGDALWAQLHELLVSLDPALWDRLEYLQILKLQSESMRNKKANQLLNQGLCLEEKPRDSNDCSKLERRHQRILAEAHEEAARIFQQAQERLAQAVVDFRAEFEAEIDKAARQLEG